MVCLSSIFSSGMSAHVPVVAAQLVGFAAGVRAAEERILVIRSASKLYQRHPVLAIENFVVEVEENKLVVRFATKQTPIVGLYYFIIVLSG